MFRAFLPHKIVVVCFAYVLRRISRKCCLLETTIEPPLSKHLWNQKECLHNRAVHLWEVKNVVCTCMCLTVYFWEVCAYRRCPLVEFWLKLEVINFWHSKLNFTRVVLPYIVEQFPWGSLATKQIQILAGFYSRI